VLLEFGDELVFDNEVPLLPEFDEELLEVELELLISGQKQTDEGDELVPF
jgi:hypothetical protein